jgi:hypothetical protein
MGVGIDTKGVAGESFVDPAWFQERQYCFCFRFGLTDRRRWERAETATSPQAHRQASA